MNLVKVSGKNNKHKVLMYGLSTCAWCRLTKKFLNQNNIEYEYVDVDLCNEQDKEKIRQEILSRGGRLSYPAIIIDDKRLINGYYEDRIMEALGI
jgi:glutaredoxin-like protein NrdH